MNVILFGLAGLNLVSANLAQSKTWVFISVAIAIACLALIIKEELKRK